MGVERALFRALIPEWVTLGYSARRMIREARALNIPTYRRTDMLGDIREFQGFLLHESQVSTYDVNKVLPKGYMTEVSLRRDRKYRIFANITTQNRVNGETDTRLVSFYSDELMTITDWEQAYQDMIEDANYKPEEEVLFMETRAVEHNTGWAY